MQPIDQPRTFPCSNQGSDDRDERRIRLGNHNVSTAEDAQQRDRSRDVEATVVECTAQEFGSPKCSSEHPVHRHSIDYL